MKNNQCFRRALVIGAISLMAALSSGTKEAVASDQPVLDSRSPPSNAAPFGLELGYATLAGVKSAIGSKTDLREDGTNEYSDGPMLSSDGAGLGIDGLSKVVFIFDRSGVLVGVLMTLPHNGMDHDAQRTVAMLSHKYRVSDDRIDSFMDDGSARLTKGSSVVLVNAPHMSFSMTVNYLTKPFYSTFLRESEKRQATHSEQQANAF